MSENQYAPGTYVKGDLEREAISARDAVALVFEGFQRVEPVEDVVEPAAPLSDEETDEMRAQREHLESLADEEFKSEATAPKPTDPKGKK